MPIDPDTAHSHPGLDAKVAFLRLPASYPESTAHVDCIETHMSWVFLTDRRAYKLKKPVRYPYLDFSTLAARRQNCEEEVRLNQALAPGVYHGTVPLMMTPEHTLRLGGAGEPIEWLVEMRRLPAARMLDKIIRDGEIEAEAIRRLGAVLADFYRHASPVPWSPRDYSERFVEAITTNLAELGAARYRLPAALLGQAHAGILAFVGGESVLLEQRARDRRIVEGHGDLRPEHVCLERRPLIFDRLEFNRELRLVDPVDELAFLAMECELLGNSSIGEILLRAYAESTGDDAPASLVRFYKGFRACLRAKIAIWHLDDPSVSVPEKWKARAETYLRLAASYDVRMA